MNFKKITTVLTVLVVSALCAIPTAFFMRLCLGSKTDSFGLWYLLTLFCFSILTVPHLLLIPCPVCSLGEAIHRGVHRIVS